MTNVEGRKCALHYINVSIYVRTYSIYCIFGFTSDEIKPLSHIRIMFLSYSDTSTPSEDIEQEHSVGGATLESQRVVWIMGEREIPGVHVTLKLPSKNTLEGTKAELLSKLSLCDPGPHVFVLTISTREHFTRKRRQEFQTHLELLGDRVWDHAIVSFFFTDNLSVNRKVEHYIEAEGKALKWLVWKCKNRYVHWKGRESRIDLLKKIEEMVVLNGGNHFHYQEGSTHETKKNWEEEIQQLSAQVEENELAKSKSIPLHCEYLPPYAPSHEPSLTDLSYTKGSVPKGS